MKINFQKLKNIIIFPLVFAVCFLNFSFFSVASASAISIIEYIDLVVDAYHIVEDLFNSVDQYSKDSCFRAAHSAIAVWSDYITENNISDEEFIDLFVYLHDYESPDDVPSGATLDEIQSIEDGHYFAYLSRAYINRGIVGGSDLFDAQSCAEYILEQCHKPASEASKLDEDNNVLIPAPIVTDYIEQENTTISPKPDRNGSAITKVSFRNHDRATLPLEYFGVRSPNGFMYSDTGELYLVPFYRGLNGSYSYCDAQIKLSTSVGSYVGSDEMAVTKLDVSCFSNALDIMGQPLYTFDFSLFDNSSGGVDGKYVAITFIPMWSGNCHLYYATYNNSSDYFSGIRNVEEYGSPTVVFMNDLFCNYYLPDRTFFKKFSDIFSYLHSKNLYSFTDSSIADVGYFVSGTKINTSYSVITSNIPDNSYFIPSGDNIYNYSIVDGDTGTTNNFNDYITNNYNYIYTPAVDDNTAGSAGDVTVGGHITVGGSVDVNIGVSVPDININVNQNGGGSDGSSIVNPDDFTSGASSVDLTSYYDKAVEDASGVRRFLASFFDFLPAELLSLLCLGVVACIVCRVFGR